MNTGSVELVLEKIGKRDDSSARVEKIRGIFSAPAAAAEKANPHSGVCLCATHQRGIDHHKSGGRRGGAQERTAVDLVCGLRFFSLLRHAGLLTEKRFIRSVLGDSFLRHGRLRSAAFRKFPAQWSPSPRNESPSSAG